MMTSTLTTYAILAEGFGYPAPGRLDTLLAGQAALAEGPVRRAYGAFVAGLKQLSLGEWEELCTRTLDLNPPAAPYVGYQTWGESYQRGAFLATMNRALHEHGVESGGELPDHLIPVLNYLASTSEPLPELVAVLDAALTRMMSALSAADPDNPYLNLLEAVRAACRHLKKEDA